MKNVKNYQKKLCAITIRMKPEHMEKIKDAAKRSGRSLRGFIMDAIEEKINSL